MSLTDPIRIRVSPRLADSYVTRGRFPTLAVGRVHHLTHEEARQVAQDARHCSDPVHGPPDLSRALRTAYSALLGQLAEHERTCDCPGGSLSQAAEIGRKGGQARARNMTPEARSEQSRRAGAARWKDHQKKTKKEDIP